RMPMMSAGATFTETRRHTASQLQERWRNTSPSSTAHVYLISSRSLSPSIAESTSQISSLFLSPQVRNNSVHRDVFVPSLSLGSLSSSQQAVVMHQAAGRRDSPPTNSSRVQPERWNTGF